jgi:hypothetical protein
VPVKFSIFCNFKQIFSHICPPSNKPISTSHYFLMLGVVAVGLALYFVWLFSLSFPPADGMVDDEYVTGLLGHNQTTLLRLGKNPRREEVPPELRMSLKGIGVLTAEL